MRRSLFGAAVAAACALSPAVAADFAEWRAVAAGSAASALALRDWQGQARTLSAWRGKVVLVNFWASWCEPCRDELPELEELRHRHAARGLDVVAVNLAETPQRVASFVRSYLPADMGLTLLLDRNSQAYRQWQVRAVPASYLIDRNGQLRWQVHGRIDIDSPATAQTIDALLAEPAGVR